MISNKYTLALVLVLCCVAYVQAGHVGGLEEERQADEKVRTVISSVTDEIRRQYPNEIETIEPLSYRTQMVAGTNYFIKALVIEKNGRRAHTHLRVWKKFTGAHELTAIKTGVDEKTELKYFQ